MIGPELIVWTLSVLCADADTGANLTVLGSLLTSTLDNELGCSAPSELETTETDRSKLRPALEQITRSHSNPRITVAAKGHKNADCLVDRDLGHIPLLDCAIDRDGTVL